MLALVEGAKKDVGIEAVVRWIEQAFRVLFDQVKAERSAKTGEFPL